MNIFLLLISPILLIIAFMGCYITKKVIDTYMAETGSALIKGQIMNRKDKQTAKAILKENKINFFAGKRS